MRNILLFEGSCAACSKVARIVISLPVPGLEVRSIDSPEVAALLAASDIQRPNRPALLVVHGERTEMLTGWAMRQRLATKLIGIRRPTAVVRLYVAEREARAARRLGPAGPPRQRLIGRTLARMLLPASAPEAREPDHAAPALVPASQADAQRALDSVPVQAAIQTWGNVLPDVYEMGSDSERVFAFFHERGNIATFTRNPSTDSGNPTALSIEIISGDEPGLRFYMVDGTLVLTLTKSDAAAKGILSTPPETVPEITKTQLKLFAACCEARITVDCAVTCGQCTGGGWGAILTCAKCAVCAGVNGISCAFDYLT